MLLIHPVGPKRLAITAFLLRLGFPSVESESVTDDKNRLISAVNSHSDRPIVVHRSELIHLPEPVQDLLRRRDSILIVPADDVEPHHFQRFVLEPYAFDDLKKVLDHAELPRSNNPSNQVALNGQRSPALLRGLAHAMNNVATSSLSWLTLAERQDDIAKRGQHLKDLRADLGRLTRLARAMSHLSVASAQPTLSNVDIHPLLLTLGFIPSIPSSSLTHGCTEREPLELALALTVSGTPANLDVRVDGDSEVSIVVADPTLDPAHVKYTELERLLETQRFSRALGIALLAQVAERCGGSLRVEPLGPHGSTVILRIPRSAALMEADQ